MIIVALHRRNMYEKKAEKSYPSPNVVSRGDFLSKANECIPKRYSQSWKNLFDLQRNKKKDTRGHLSVDLRRANLRLVFAIG